LEAYPFERMNALKAGTNGNPDHPHVALSIGEPKHPPPGFVIDALTDRDRLIEDIAAYPATRGGEELRTAIAAWLEKRFAVPMDAESGVLPVAGTREALFSFGQAVMGEKPDPVCILPNPFYQIYEGAALLAGAEPWFANTDEANDFLPDFRAIPESVWRRCELVYVCSPGNPTGRCMDRDSLNWLLDQADRYDFVVAADECYSEIYPDESDPPASLLQVARDSGRTGYERCVVFHSLSKRSSLPGLRSGFVAGDRRILDAYFAYRTYEGCALGNHVQRASALAWSDEEHVVANRALYRAKFEAVTPILETAFSAMAPEGGFYHWLPVGGDDCAFTLELFKAENITVLPGSFLGRSAGGTNPGAGYVRVAWVAGLAECVDAAERLSAWARHSFPAAQ
jgi:N-succinyldiaminopimelate aminotransferase